MATKREQLAQILAETPDPTPTPELSVSEEEIDLIEDDIDHYVKKNSIFLIY